MTKNDRSIVHPPIFQFTDLRVSRYFEVYIREMSYSKSFLNKEGEGVRQILPTSSTVISLFFIIERQSRKFWI